MLRKAYLYLRYHWLLNICNAWRNVFLYRSIKLSTMNYEEYWQGNHSEGFSSDNRIPVFLRLVEPHASVVEIGCGDGMLLELLQTHRAAKVKGYDVSENAVQKARARQIDAEVYDASRTKMEEGADYIIIADCLEHLAVPEELFEQLRGKFRKALLVSIPNSCYWRYRFRVLFGKFIMQWVAHPGEHLRFWSVVDMHWWVKEMGYKIDKFYPTWGIPVLKHLWPNMFAQNVLYVIV